MFWMFVKVALLVLYILSGLGVIVMNITLQCDVQRYIKKNKIKREPHLLSEKVAAIIHFGINIFCPIWNFVVLLLMVSNQKEILNNAFDALLYRPISKEEEE